MEKAVIEVKPYDKESKDVPRCSFCKATQEHYESLKDPGKPRKVRRHVRMIKGPGVNICEACAQICHELLYRDFYDKLDAAVKEKRFP